MASYMRPCCILVLLLSFSSSESRHPLLQRQANTDLCETILDRDQCTDGYFEDTTYLKFQCNQTAEAQYIHGTCGSNLMGIICNSLGGDPQEVERVCGSSPTTCTTDCRNLLTTTRAQLGCCVTVFNESTSANSDENSFQPFRYSLWSLCGVEPVTEQCAPSFNLPTNINHTCNVSEFEQLVYSRVNCRTEFIESLRRALEAREGCLEELYDDYDEDIRSLCTVNEQGLYCGAEPVLSEKQRLLQAATTNCDDISTCARGCMETLNDITSTAGCCFIDEYNGTVGWDWLSYEFWQACGLTSPGPCEARFDNSPTRVSRRVSGAAILTKAPETTVVFAVGLLLNYAGILM